MTKLIERNTTLPTKKGTVVHDATERVPCTPKKKPCLALRNILSIFCGDAAPGHQLLL